MTFHITQGTRKGLINQNIVDSAIFIEKTSNYETIPLDCARLSESFYTQLQNHAVPINEAAIRALSNNSFALDLYCWLSYRLRVVRKPTPITWAALRAQFGTTYTDIKHFRPRFIAGLKLAMAVYEDAHLEMDEAGLVLLPSKAPVPMRLGQKTT